MFRIGCGMTDKDIIIVINASNILHYLIFMYSIAQDTPLKIRHNCFQFLTYAPLLFIGAESQLSVATWQLNFLLWRLIFGSKVTILYDFGVFFPTIYIDESGGVFLDNLTKIAVLFQRFSDGNHVFFRTILSLNQRFFRDRLTKIVFLS